MRIQLCFVWPTVLKDWVLVYAATILPNPMICCVLRMMLLLWSKWLTVYKLKEHWAEQYKLVLCVEIKFFSLLHQRYIVEIECLKIMNQETKILLAAVWVLEHNYHCGSVTTAVKHKDKLLLNFAQHFKIWKKKNHFHTHMPTNILILIYILSTDSHFIKYINHFNLIMLWCRI